jgi:hypothetical protein
VGALISDHNIINCNLHLCRPPLPIKTITLRKLKAIDQQAVQEDLQSRITTSCDSFPHLHLAYDTLLSDLLNTFAPEKTVTITIRPKSPWIDETILQEKRKRRKCESKWRQTRLAVHRQIYTHQRDSVNKLIQAAKVNYYGELISQCKNDQKALFRIVKGLLSKCTTETSGNTLDIGPNEFNDFFLNKINKIYDSLQAYSTPAAETEPQCLYSLENFMLVTEAELKTIISKSPTKSSVLDPWPTWMVKKHLATLLPLMTAIVNQSLSSAVFPSEWKHALVTPLLKKPSLDPLVLSNYRPVSNLPFVSKVVERVVSKQLTNYLQSNCLYPVFQSAYRQCHSVETALLRVQNDILQALDNQQGVILVLLDLSAAFDTISHDMLLCRLQHRFGLSGTVLAWIASYLHHRSQSVILGHQKSAALPVSHGVPQG